MDVGPAFIADAQAPELMKPTERAFDDPAHLAETAAVGLTALGDARLNAPAPQEDAVHLGVIGAVGIEAVGALSRASRLASNRRDSLHQPYQLRHVVPVGSGQLARQRGSMGVRDDVVLATLFAPVRRIGACLSPPKTARTEELSTMAHDKSIRSALRNSSSSKRWIRSQTPAFCQSRKRRQQVIPDPQPNSCGKSSHGIPLLRTNTIPVSTNLSFSGGRPPLGRGGRFGNSGLTRAKNVSVISGLAITPSSMTDGWFTTAFTVAGRNHNENPLNGFC